MGWTVKDLADLVGGSLRGESTTEVERAAPAGEGRVGDICFVERPRDLARALESAASCVIVGEGMETGAATAIVVANPKLAFARVLAVLYPQDREPAGIHPTAVVDKSARLGRDVHVGPHASVSDGVSLGDRVVVGAGSVVGRGVEVGEDTYLFPRVVVYPGTVVGKRVRVHAGAVLGSDGFGYVTHAGGHEKFPQVGNLVVGDDVEIGANTTVDRGALGSTRIEAGSKIDNLVQVAHNVQIGERCILSAQTGIAGSSVVEEDAILAGQVGVGDHVTIKKGAILGGQAGVAPGKIIREGQIVWGTPARPLKDFKLQSAHVTRLPELARTVKELARRLGVDDGSQGGEGGASD